MSSSSFYCSVYTQEHHIIIPEWKINKMFVKWFYLVCAHQGSHTCFLRSSKKRHNTAGSDKRKNYCRISDFLSLHLSSCQTISNQSEVSTADIQCLVLIWFCDDLKFKVSLRKIIRLLNIWTWYLIIFHHLFVAHTNCCLQKHTLNKICLFFLICKMAIFGRDGGFIS